MANPVQKEFAENEVELLASGIDSGWINRDSLRGRGVSFCFSYRTAGDTAPTIEELKLEAFLGFQDHPEQELINSDVLIDVYGYGSNGDSDEADICYLTVNI